MGADDMTSTIDEYVAGFPSEVRAVLEEVRRRLHATLPGAGETISYGIPTFTIEGRRALHFAGWKQHVSLYPVPDGDEAFQHAIAPYRSGASTAKFSLRKPIPYELIERWAELLAQQ